MNIIFGGYYFEVDAKRRQLDIICNPDDLAIDDGISMVAQSSGVAVLRLDPAPNFGNYELVLHGDCGNFLLMLNEIARDEEIGVKVLTNEAAENTIIDIMGEVYPAKAVINDLAYVKIIFKEFLRSNGFRSGNFSTLFS